jgi:hypothetical protein
LATVPPQLDLSDEDAGEPAFEDARRVRYSPRYPDAVACVASWRRSR